MTTAEAAAAARVTKLRLHDGSHARQAGDIARVILQRWIRAPTTPQRVALRSRIVLLSLDGVRIRDIAARLGVSPATVLLWTRRFAERGPDALLHDAPGRGRRPRMTAASMYERLRQANLLGQDNLPVSIRRAAAALGVSATSVWRALRKPSCRKHGSLKPPSEIT